MRKVLCPICGNVIRFDENQTSLTCDVCRSAIKIKIQSIDDKNIVSEPEFGIPTEQLFSEDEIITAELDKSAPEAKLDFSRAGTYKGGETSKKTPPVVGVKRANPMDNKVSVAADLYGKIETKSEPIKASKEDFAAVDAEAYYNYAEPENVVKETSKDAEIKWINWADIECESELLEDDGMKKPSEAAKGKKKFKVPLNYRLAYIPTYAICTFISAIMLLYTPFLNFRNGINFKIYGANLIGELFNVANYSSGSNIFLLVAGASMAVMVLIATGYLIFAFRNYGEYNLSILKKSCLLAAVGLFFTVMLLAMLLTLFTTTYHNYSGFKISFSGVIIALPLQLYVFLSNVDKLPKYRDAKKVLLSPKSTCRKAYTLLCIAMFFVWTLLFNTVISLGSNVAYNAIYTLSGGTSPILPKLSALSLGAFGSAFTFVWDSYIPVVSATANYLIYTYIQYATLAVTALLVIIYSRYAGKTAGIFLDEIKPKGNENVLLANEIKERNLAKFLKKSSSRSFVVYAVAITLDLAGYVVLYSGTSNLIPALFTMISFVIAALIRRYPYAVLAREQYMKAYVEYEEMGADIPPMTKQQRSKLEWAALFAAAVCSLSFVLSVFL